jgi:hypothetical protein
MRSVIIRPRTKKEFDVVFSLLKEFGKERNRLSLDEDDDICFAFLVKETESAKEVASNVIMKKSKR